MKHTEGDVIKPRDCIIVASGHRKKDLPFIAKVTAIWEDPDDGELEIAIFDNFNFLNNFDRNYFGHPTQHDFTWTQSS